MHVKCANHCVDTPKCDKNANSCMVLLPGDLKEDQPVIESKWNQLKLNVLFHFDLVSFFFFSFVHIF